MSSPDTGPANRDPARYGSIEEYVEHALYYIVHTDAQGLPGYPRPVAGQLLYPAPGDDEDGGIAVLTGTMFGPVLITVETYDSPEDAVPAPGAWEIVQEVGIVARGSDLHIVTEPLVKTELPRLRLAPGEPAGVRLHARGHREAAEIKELTGPDDTAVEHHLLQLWRA